MLPYILCRLTGRSVTEKFLNGTPAHKMTFSALGLNILSKAAMYAESNITDKNNW